MPRRAAAVAPVEDPPAPVKVPVDLKAITEGWYMGLRDAEWDIGGSVGKIRQDRLAFLVPDVADRLLEGGMVRKARSCEVLGHDCCEA